MEYQKLIHLLDNTPNQPSKFKTKNWAEINYDPRSAYNTNIQIKFKTSMLRSSLCDYSDGYILVRGTITITGRPGNTNDSNKKIDRRNKEVISKNCAPFTKCISEINNAKADDVEDLDIVMPTYHKCSNNYSKISGSLWKYCRDELALDNNGNINSFPGNSSSFKSKVEVTRKAPADGTTKDVRIVVPLKYLINFWRTLEIPLINCEVNLILIWSSTCVIINSTGVGTFAMADKKLYVLFVTLSTQDNAKLIE